MEDELTEKMHSEFTIDAETDKKHKCFAVWQQVGINATTEKLNSILEFSGVTMSDIEKYKNEYFKLKNSK